MKIVFILFMARSGSTWLGKMLSAHPQVLYHQHAWMNKRGRLRDEDKRDFGRKILELSQYRGRAYDCRPYFPQPDIPQIMVLKDSHAAQEPELCLKHSHRSIVLIRHPMAQINSVINHYPNGKFYGIEASARRWAERNSRYLELARSQPDRIKVIKFEHLIKDPRKILKPIVEWMGLEWRAGIDTFIRESNSRHDPAFDSIYKNRNAVNQAWEKRLSPWARRTIRNAIAGSTAGRLYAL